MSESADNYGRVVTRLNARWRIVECPHRLQWILQRTASAKTSATSRWQSRSFCGTRDGLLRCSREHAGAIDTAAAAVLAALPERIDDVSFNFEAIAHAMQFADTRATELWDHEPRVGLIELHRDAD
jgi:hypothetical protein